MALKTELGLGMIVFYGHTKITLHVEAFKRSYVNSIFLLFFKRIFESYHMT